MSCPKEVTSSLAYRGNKRSSQGVQIYQVSYLRGCLKISRHLNRIQGFPVNKRRYCFYTSTAVLCIEFLYVFFFFSFFCCQCLSHFIIHYCWRYIHSASHCQYLFFLLLISLHSNTVCMLVVHQIYKTLCGLTNKREGIRNICCCQHTHTHTHTVYNQHRTSLLLCLYSLFCLESWHQLQIKNNRRCQPQVWSFYFF